MLVNLFSVTLIVSSAAKHLLLLHASTPLTVHRIRMHSDLIFVVTVTNESSNSASTLRHNLLLVDCAKLPYPYTLVLINR